MSAIILFVGGMVSMSLLIISMRIVRASPEKYQRVRDVLVTGKCDKWVPYTRTVLFIKNGRWHARCVPTLATLRWLWS